MCEKSCYYEGCNEDAVVKGLCLKHYNLWIGNISKIPRYCNWSLEKRFWHHVWKPTKDGCWLWRGNLIGNGYGKIWLKELNSNVEAHRLSWELHYGHIPNGMNVLHKCDTPACVNPAHLWLGTQSDNVKDSVRKERAFYGEKHNMAKLKESEVLEIRGLLKDSTFMQEDIAKMFNVHCSLISCIKLYKIWHYPEILKREQEDLIL